MAKFYIGTPGGYEVEVSAATQDEALAIAREQWQTMPKLIARQEGDVRVFERQNGQRYVVTPGYSTTDPDRVAEILGNIEQHRPAGGAVRSAIDEELIAQHPFASRAVKFVEGVPAVGSYVDEAIGAVMGQDATAGIRALSGAMSRERPWQSLGLNLAGGAAATAGVAAAAPKAVTAGVNAILGQGTRLAQAGRAGVAGSVLGAAEGSIYGSGEGTTGAERARRAGVGAAIGAGAGGVMGLASPYVKAGVQNIISRVSNSDIGAISQMFNISRQAATVIKNTFEMGGGIDDAIKKLDRAGGSGMLADANEATQALLDATAASSPTASRAVREPLDRRMTEAAGLLDTGLTRSLGLPAEGPRTAVAEIMGSSREARTRAYDAAYRTPIDYSSPAGREIESVLERVEPNVLRQAINEANADMIDLGLRNQQILVDIADNGAVTFREMPNVRQLDAIKKALGSLSEGARRTEGVTTVDTPASIRYGRQASDLRDAIRNATGGADGPYAEALKIGGDTIAERRAFLLGESLTSTATRVEDVLLELGKNPSRAALEAARRGLRTRIDEVVGNVRRIPSDPNIDARQALQTLRELGSDNVREKIRRLMGRDADAIFRLLDEASAAAETRAATAVNSRTAIRTATQENVAELTQPGIVGQAARGEAVNTTKAMIQAVTGQTAQYDAAQRQRIYLDIARALTETRGDRAQTALRALDAAMQGQRLTDRQTELLAREISAVLFGVSATQLGRSISQ